MQKQKKLKKRIINFEVLGSETVLEKIRRKTPWIFGTWIRKPKIVFPTFRSRRLKLPHSPRSLNLITILIILFVLQTGIVYLILRKPPALGVDSEKNPVFIWLWTVYEAYVIESIVASILIFLASIGFFLLYHASKYVYNKKLADGIMVIAIFMIAISFVLLQIMLRSKVKSRSLTSS